MDKENIEIREKLSNKQTQTPEKIDVINLDTSQNQDINKYFAENLEPKQSQQIQEINKQLEQEQEQETDLNIDSDLEKSQVELSLEKMDQAIEKIQNQDKNLQEQPLKNEKKYSKLLNMRIGFGGITNYIFGESYEKLETQKNISIFSLNKKQQYQVGEFNKNMSRYLFSDLYSKQLERQAEEEKNRQAALDLIQQEKIQELKQQKIQQQQQINFLIQEEKKKNALDKLLIKSVQKPQYRNLQEENLIQPTKFQKNIVEIEQKKEFHKTEKKQQYPSENEYEESNSESDDEVIITKVIKKKDKKKKDQKKDKIYKVFEPENSQAEKIDNYKYKVKKMEYRVQGRKEKKKFGSFEKDQPNFISKHKLDYDTFKKLHQHTPEQTNMLRIQYYLYFVEWKLRDSGRQPLGHYYTYKELKKICPRILLEYLEKLGQLLR